MTNYVSEGEKITIVCTHPETPEAGGPVRIGELCGVAQSAEAADGTTVVMLRGVVDISVKGVDGDGNSAVAVGDKLFYVDADSPPVSKKDSGRFFGHALETVSAGGTDTINVLLGGDGRSA